ncbi:helix-turn-helix transcriptional regulator [Microbispora corallina]|uniref:Transcriptional regulator n=1 Tax=Microbispora corallina TaxID=83302 RepID=A0ABQ4FYJ8_9ACTN|nr:helix-turn-helix transcriptional regulator [Microbispora corallina]GIH39899.1 transcriptional regulator [Microbispora corallina]
MDRAAGLGEFLRSRRARIRPHELGEAASPGRRRVPGLRREELARLAGVSVDYYTRLEQGRGGNVSPEVLDAIARALRLDQTERAHLYDLAAVTHDRPRHPADGPQRVGAETYQLLHALDRAEVPAVVMGRRQDVLAANLMHRALVNDFESLPPRERNMGRFLFLDPRTRELYPDWETVAGDVAALLRFDLGRHPRDPLLRALIDELSAASEDFRRLWADHRVHEQVHGTKHIRHPVAGELTVTFQALALPAENDQWLFAYTAAPGSPDAEALAVVADTFHRSPSPPFTS